MGLSKRDLRKIGQLCRRFPIHPQWLLGQRRVVPAICRLTGVVLDVGCADRWIESHLPKDAIYIGLDYPVTGSSLYSARADVFADASQLPVSSGSIDAIVCLEVLEHVRDYPAALHEFFRVLKPGGVLIVSMPFLYPTHDAPHDYQRLTEYGLRRDVEAPGFEVVRMDKVGHSVKTAGLLLSLSLAGGLLSRGRPIDFLRLPFIALLVSFVNLSAWALSCFLPDWDALGAGFEVQAVKR